MKYLIILIFALNLIASAQASECDIHQANPDLVKKLNATNLRGIPCVSLTTALGSYLNKKKQGGRRLGPDDEKNEKEINEAKKSICQRREYVERIREANAIKDNEVRVIITAAILDEADETSAKEIIIENESVRLCTSGK